MNALFDKRYENIFTAVAAVIAAFVVYTMLPTLTAKFMPEAIGSIWSSPLSVMQGLTIISAMVLIGITLFIADRFHRSELNRLRSRPIWVFIAVPAVISVCVIAGAAIIAFGVTIETLLSFGADYTVALSVCLLAIPLTLWVMK